ncbi:MAG: dienelactone hydrolase family protein [Proteobacteria bacterium]|nr:dienelactone hydrolase family protein [Pseudomonadota bacterium]
METLTLEAEGKSWPASMILPEGPGPHPGVVVIHDITGFRNDTLRHCRRFADAGYAAIAPDLYDGHSPRCIVSTFATMAKEQGTALTLIEAARARLAEEENVDASRIAVTGFCMGGGFALLAGADGAYAVAAPFYGAVPAKQERLEGICPTLAQFGGQDLAFRGMSSRLSRHLTALGVTHEVIVHPDAGHSFMNDHPDLSFKSARFTPLRGRYEPEVEARAWARLLQFLGEHMSAEHAETPPTMA